MNRPLNLREKYVKPLLEVVDYFSRKPVELSHKEKVVRTYRKALRMNIHWNAPYRSTINQEATKLRSQFDANKNLSEREGLEKLEEAWKHMEVETHPDPYCIPWMPGGSSYMRYVPQPLSRSFPWGVPEEIHRDFQPVYYDQVPYHWRPEEFRDEPFICDVYRKETY